MFDLIFSFSFFFFFFNDTATTEIYTLSLHDALPIYHIRPAERPHISIVGMLIWRRSVARAPVSAYMHVLIHVRTMLDRKSTRLNSSHTVISYAVFCLKKKKKKKKNIKKLRTSSTCTS